MTQATLSQERHLGNHQQVSLLDLLDRLLDKGVVVDGEILLTVADIDLVYLGLKCVLASVETLEKNSRDPLSVIASEQSERSNLTEGHPEPFGACHSERSEESTRLEGKLREGPRDPSVASRPQDDARRQIDLALSGTPSRNDNVEEAPLSAKTKTQMIESRQDFRETPFFENAEAKRTHPNPEPRNKINIESEKVEKGLIKLVLTVVELLRKLMERQAIRRMEGGSLKPRKIEELGLAFLRLDEKMEELKKFFGLKDEDFNLSLGPLGNLI